MWDRRVAGIEKCKCVEVKGGGKRLASVLYCMWGMSETELVRL